MLKTFTFSYTEDVIPPRCRRSRPMRFDDGEVKLHIPEPDPDIVPVAIRQYRENKLVLEYRWYDGKLWTKEPPVPASYGHTNRYPYNLEQTPYAYSRGRTKAEVTKSFVDWANEMILLGDQIWKVAEEPMYFIDPGSFNWKPSLEVCFSHEPQYPRSLYVPVSRRDVAVERATKHGERWKGNQSLKDDDLFSNRVNFEVLIPEAIQTPVCYRYYFIVGYNPVRLRFHVDASSEEEAVETAREVLMEEKQPKAKDWDGDWTMRTTGRGWRQPATFNIRLEQIRKSDIAHITDGTE